MKSKVYIAYTQTLLSNTLKGHYDWEKIYKFEIETAQLQEPDSGKYWCQEIEHVYPLKAIYIVIVTYTDSDTFGRSTGLKDLHGIYLKLSLAKQAVDKAKSNGRFGYNVTEVELKLMPLSIFIEDLDTA